MPPPKYPRGLDCDTNVFCASFTLSTFSIHVILTSAIPLVHLCRIELFADIPPTSLPTQYTCSTQTAPTPHPSTSTSTVQLQYHGAYNPPSRANSTTPISSRFWTMIRMCLCVSYPPYPVLTLILLTDAHSKIEVFSLNMSSLKAGTSKPPME